MTITARVERDSISPAGHRLTTFVLRLPKFLLAQLNTHRAFSRSASSSRAIPIERVIADVIVDPVIPMWTKNQRGMQGATLEDEAQRKAEGAWREALDSAVMHARQMAKAGAHKQSVNRVLEPFAHASVVLTSCRPGLDNFYALRCDHAAQPEMQALAEAMLAAQRASKPVDVGDGWHLPFTRPGDPVGALLDVSVARCARVSYDNHDGTAPDVAKDIALALELRAAGHMGPFEHQATPLGGILTDRLSGNLPGWCQYRKTLAGECRAYEGGRM